MNSREEVQAAQNGPEVPAMAFSLPNGSSARFIPDLPAPVSAFEPHTRITRAIRDIVLNDSTSRVIGLTGSYGAGKSTVVQLLRTELEQEVDAELWVFDAWAHEGDPLRRSFLESLVQHLCKTKWIARREGVRLIRDLSRRSRTTESTNSYDITPFAAVFALTLLLVPLGHVLLGPELPLRFGLRRETFSLVGTLAFALALSPVISVLAFAGIRWLKLRKDSERSAWSELGSLLIEKTNETTRSHTSETLEPTSIEFERHFRRVMREALDAPTRRIVLVIDNLDRVEPEDAQRIWSTLRTFLDADAAAREEAWFSRVWIILPYDPDGIRRLWNSGTTQQEENGSEGTSLVRSFLDKTVDVRFDVPPPLLADWRSYFIELLKQVLPEHVADSDFHKIYRLLAVVRGERKGSPSPRELKILANQIGAIHQLRGDDVPLLDLAYYVILDRGFISISRELLAGDLPRRAESHLVTDNAAQSLAALAFGVEPKVGQQVLLAPPIREALSGGDGTELKRLQELSPAFGEVLEHTLAEVADQWATGGTETANLLSTALALKRADILSDCDHHIRANLLNVLQIASLEALTWNPLTPEISEGICALCELLPSLDVARHSLESLGRSLPKELVKGYPAPADLGQMAVDIGNCLISLKLEDALRPGIAVPGNAEAYLDAFAIAAAGSQESNDLNSPLLRILRPSTSAEALVSALAHRTELGHFRQTELLVLRLLAVEGLDVGLEVGAELPELGELTNAIRDRFASGEMEKPIEVNSLVGALQVLIQRLKLKSAKDTLSTLFSSGVASTGWRASTGDSPDHVRARARLLYGQMLVDPGFTSVLSGPAQKSLLSELSTPSASVAACIARLCEHAGNRSQLLTVGKKAPQARPLVGEVLKQLYVQGRSSSFFSGKTLAENWQLLPKSFKLEDLLGNDPRRASAVARHLETGTAQVEQVPLYNATLRSLQYRKKFAKWLRLSLNMLAEEAWLEDLSGSGTWLTSALLLADYGHGPDLQQAFRTALFRYFRSLKAGEAKVLPPSGTEVTSLLDPGDRAAFEDELFGDLVAHPLSWNNAAFELFGSLLTRHSEFTRDETLITRVYLPLIEGRSSGGVTWLRQLIEERGQALFKGINKDRVRAVRRALSQELAAERNDQVASDIKKIAGELGIKKPRRKT